MLSLLSKIFGGLISQKVLLSFLVVTVLGIIFYNLVVEIIEEVMTFALSAINGADYRSMSIPSFSGFSGWFIAQIKIPECLSVVTSAVALKFILRKIPFLKW